MSISRSTAGSPGLYSDGHVLVGPVGRQRVLNQIVGADGEEIHLAGQLLRHDGRRGHLDHRADRQLAVEGDALFFQVFLHFRQDHLALAQLQQRADHREHDAHVAEGTGSQDGTHLRFEQGQIPQAQAHAAQAQERIALVVPTVPT